MDIVKRAVVKQEWSNGSKASADRRVGGPDGLLSRLIPFDSQGAMRARRYEGRPHTRDDIKNSFSGPYGRLDGHDMSIATPLYVVWSYETPIAWVSWCGSICIPDEKYSVTTTHHQNMCHAWMGSGTVWSDQDQTGISWTTQAVRDAEKGVWV